MSPSFRSLVTVFLKAGTTAFGGGDPTVLHLQREIVERKGWLTDQQFQLCYGLARLTPGTNLLAFCAAMGAQLRGLPGAALAVLSTGTPAALLTVLLASLYTQLRHNLIANAALEGLLAVTVGAMLGSAALLAQSRMTSGRRYRVLGILAAIIALAYWPLSPVRVVLLGAGAGALLLRRP